MSKFLNIIEALTPSNGDTSTSVLSDIQKKPDSELSPAEKKVKSAYLQKLNKLANKLQTEEEVPQSPEEAPTGAEVSTLSPEGEVFYVDLIKKALFVDLDNVQLTSQEKDVVTSDVTPSNAKEVAEILRKIISDYGLES